MRYEKPFVISMAIILGLMVSVGIAGELLTKDTLKDKAIDDTSKLKDKATTFITEKTKDKITDIKIDKISSFDKSKIKIIEYKVKDKTTFTIITRGDKLK